VLAEDDDPAATAAPDEEDEEEGEDLYNDIWCWGWKSRALGELDVM